jgi:hypothetical protein
VIWAGIKTELCFWVRNFLQLFLYIAFWCLHMIVFVGGMAHREVCDKLKIGRPEFEFQQ